MDTTASGPAMESPAQGVAPTNGAGAVGPHPQVGSAAPAEPGRPPENVSQEIRLAVVMYGGVSLAIYMNGIAEELYHLVRATAPGQGDRRGRALLAEPGDGEAERPYLLTSTETVYRRLGQMLVRGAPPKALDDLDRDSEIRTRFVVDVLSGTSAGGINAIFLAKALSNGQPFENLKSFWIKEGAIAGLINDPGSVRDLNGALPAPGEPRSLLNSQRMYVKLLDAFGDMSKQGQGGPSSPYVDELDLYVTTTDIRGVPVPLQLNEPLFELRHRHVFHFRYGLDEATNRLTNHFEQANDPYLAFVARCTSAFPFALEPVQETDIENLLASVDRVRTSKHLPIPPERWDLWRKFGPIDPSLTEADRQKRAYGDGGYLDNKPFGHAIDALARRQPTVPVDRKLLFIDPSPEHPNWARQGDNPPDVIENVTAALSLARYETIRDDVRRILDDNRLLEKVQRITARQDVDLEQVMPKAPPPAPMQDFIRQDLGDMVQRWGIAYAALHRIKVTEVTDELATYIASAAGFDLESELYAVVRGLVRGWRERRFVRFRTADD